MAQFAFVFPGQGSQSIGMLQNHSESHSLIRDTMDEASCVLDYNLWDVCSEGPLETLNSTEVTQVAMLAADIALWRVWRDQEGPMPTTMAGHSLGEYAALVASGALAFVDAIRLVQRRGQLMQSAQKGADGAMAAIIGCDDDEVSALCDATAEGQVLTPANFNSPGQVVIAGESDAIDRACSQAKAFGARLAKRLPVSVAAHCQLMAPAQSPFNTLLESVSFQAPTVPVIQNVGLSAHQDPSAIKSALVQQLVSPVPWVSTIKLLSQSVSAFVECGPGKVLAGLCKRISPDSVTYVTNTSDSLHFALTQIQQEGV